MKKYLTFHYFIQVGLMAFTIAGFLLTALKLPQYGLLCAFISQFFWLYSSYKAWKEANQIGIFLVSIVILLIVSSGIINYWLIK